MEDVKQTADETKLEDTANNSEPGICNDTTAADDTSEHDRGKMQTLLVEKQKLADELSNRLVRLQADFENFRRRSRQEKSEMSTMVTADVIKKLLPVLDNFERALNSADTQDVQALRSGIEMIHRQLISSLEKIGVETIIALDMPFNPEQHEAVMRAQDDSRTDGTIIEELQKGYLINGTVIRPTMVKVVANS